MKKIISLSLSSIIFLFFVLNSFVSAQSPVLLKDINKVLQPTGLLLGTQSGSKFFFSRTTPENGWEIWITDGSVAGTHILKDIVPGPDSSVPYNFSPAKKADIDIVYFTATTPSTGRELWVSDGTEVGTVLVEDINPGASSSDPQYLSVVPNNSAVIFAATTAATGREVWYSADGTAANTDLLFDVRPGVNSSDPKDIVYAGGSNIIWSADDGAHGREPWKYSGTASLLLDIAPGVASSAPYGFILNGASSKFYFSATRAAEGTELWSTDFTTTAIVKDIAIGTSSSKPSSYQNINPTTTLFLTESSFAFQLWKTDGTSLGTSLVYNFGSSFPIPALLNAISGGDSFGGIKGIFNPIAVNNGKVYFFVSNPIDFIFDLFSFTGELWVSDGTPAGTMQVSDVFPGIGGTFGLNMASVNSSLLSFMDNGTQGIELWKSQGTEATTSQVVDLNPGLASFFDTQFGALGGSLGGFVAGTTGILAQGSVGLQQKIIFSDGTAANTREIADVSDSTKNKTSIPLTLGTIGNKALFSANDGTIGSELYITDGTPVGTQLLKDINPFSSSFINQSSQSFLNGNKTLFVANDFNSGAELWVTDGTTGNTQLLKDIFPGTASSRTSLYNTELNGEILFGATDGVNGFELWATNGTPEGTRLVKDINPGSANSSIYKMILMDNKVYFSGYDNTSGSELWVSDGTNAGTQILIDIVPGMTGSQIDEITKIGSTLYFSANDNIHGEELWKSDGTVLGTVLVKDITVGATGSFIDSIVPLGSLVLFGASDNISGKELWSSDGTAANTVLVKDIKAGASGSGVNLIKVIGNRAIFSANDGIIGSELWVSAGTSATTILLKDIQAGPSSSNPYNIYPFPGTSLAVFSAYDSTNGTELWKTDGTPDGTVLVGDFVPGTNSSSPGNFLGVNGNLIFTMDKDNLGYEPWSITLDQCPTDLNKLNTGLCGCGAVDSNSDQDSDGTLDCLDSCPNDAAKVTVGTCGCGVVDSDANANSVIDCLSGKDVKAQIKEIQKKLSGLKPAKSKKQLKKLKVKAKLVKKLLTGLINFSNTNSSRITISGKVSLKKLISQIKKDVSLALKLKSSLSKDSAKGRKTLGKLAKVIL